MLTSGSVEMLMTGSGGGSELDGSSGKLMVGIEGPSSGTLMMGIEAVAGVGEGVRARR